MKIPRDTLLRYSYCLAIALLHSFLFPLTASAQETPAAQGEPIVGEIEVVFEGVQTVSIENVMAHVRLRIGDPFNQNLVDQSIRSLYQTGNYEFIEVRRQDLPNGEIAIGFIVVPKYRISQILFEGNDEEDDGDLSDEIESEVGLPLDEVLVKRDANKLFHYYQKEGFTNAKVSYEIERNDQLGTGVVIFKIDEGEQLVINNIEFVGNEHVEASDLEEQMETTEYICVVSWLLGNGRLQEEIFQDDLEKLRTYYKNQGYLDVEIPESKVVLEYPDSGDLDIIIHVDEGRRYYVGDIAFEGNELYPTEELIRILPIRTGDPFSPEQIDSTIERLKDYYGEVGYLDTFVRVERYPNIEGGTIDLKFIITEGERFILESITLTGNTKTKSRVIIRELALAPGDTFDLVRMKASQARLENTRFFEEVRLSPEATNIPGRRNLRISVKEGDTGNLTFGAGFSSVESIVGFVELTQSNFDIFNARNWFQGGGQKFRLRISIGARSNQVLLSFEEPWLWERELAGGFDAFRTETNYLSTEYNELRTGVEIYLRKRLFELVEGRLFYRLELVDIKDVQPSAALTVQMDAGERSVSTGGFTLLRDTRDNLVFPTKGSRVEYTSSLSGGPFGGQTDYIRQQLNGAIWFKTFDWANQVISFRGRTGTVIPYDNNSVPFFDKYYLGGPYSLRGFQFRKVGPKQTNPTQPGYGEPLGGDTMGFASVEYTWQILEPLRFAVFYDWGFVNSNDANWDPGAYNDNYGFGIRLLLMGAPLNLDFGFPLKSDQFNDDGMQFNFSFGTVF